MAKKLLVARLGARSITIALCAALPGCNLALVPSDDCVGHPSSRGKAFVVCGSDGAQPDQAGDALVGDLGVVGQTGDASHSAEASADSSCDAVADTGKDQVSGDGL